MQFRSRSVLKYAVIYRPQGGMATLGFFYLLETAQSDIGKSVSLKLFRLEKDGHEI